MREALKWALKLSQTEVLKRHKIHPVADRFGSQGFTPFSDKYFECLLRHWSHTVYHPAGTCKMGPSSDLLAVVDNELRVHGIDNLRVMDASVMPAIVGCNTNAPTIMIGEKGADLILKKWKQNGKKSSTKKVDEKIEL